MEAPDVTRAAPDDAQTQELVSSAVGDRCTNCQAPLASDQRYCVTCGERRGKARFNFAAPAAPAAAPAPSPKRERAPRPSSGATLIAGVATLLLAMGIGFLIGNANNNGNTRAAAAPPQVITVAGNALGGGASNLAPTTVQPGQACSHGAGCQGGKFTGNFVGP